MMPARAFGLLLVPLVSASRYPVVLNKNMAFPEIVAEMTEGPMYGGGKGYIKPVLADTTQNTHAT
jgi:hypothetical protein